MRYYLRQQLGVTEVNNENSGDSFSPAKGFNSRALKKNQGRCLLSHALSATMILSVGAARQLAALPTPHDRHRVFGAQCADSSLWCVTG